MKNLKKRGRIAYSCGLMMYGGVAVLILTQSFAFPTLKPLQHFSALTQNSDQSNGSDIVFSVQDIQDEQNDRLVDVPGEINKSNLCQQQTSISVQECEKLIELYHATNGPDWTYSNGWNQDQSVCDRYGVVCTGQKVVALQLDHNNLNGIIPNDLSSLSDLRILDLSNNTELKGPIHFLTTLSQGEKILLQNNSHCGRLSSTMVQKLQTDSLFKLFAQGNNLILDQAAAVLYSTIGEQSQPTICN